MSDQKQAEKPQDEIVGEFEMRRSEIASIFEKMQELDSDRLEHELVLKTLNKLEPERRCFRLVNNVLVERTVAEVLPAVTANSDKVYSRAIVSIACLLMLFDLRLTNSYRRWAAS